MEKYKISIRKSAVKELESLSKDILTKLVSRIRSLGDNPRPSGSQKLSTKEQYRLRQGDYRIIYSIQDNEKAIQIVKIGHRKDVYR